nr:hypothetical protein [Acinetobacter sp. Marseille-Q1620]
MKYFIIIYLCIIWGKVWGVSCELPINDEFLHTETIYPDSVYWISPIDGDDIKDKFITLNSESDKDNAMLLEYIADQKLIKLTPKNKLKNEKYELKSAVIPNYVRGDTHPIEVNTSIPIKKLHWIEKPKFISTKKKAHYQMFGWGGGSRTEILFNLKTNLDPKQYLINVKSYENLDSTNFESYLARPFLSENNVESFELWSGFNRGCPRVRKQQDFSFQQGQTVYLKFDLITHDGLIIPWQGEPEAYVFDDIKKINEQYGCFSNQDNNSIKNDQRVFFISPISTNINILQSNQFYLDINVVVKSEDGNDFDWLIPQSEFLSILNENKIYLKNKTGHIINEYGNTQQNEGITINSDKYVSYESIIENITPLAKFTKRSEYIFNFTIPLPRNLGESFDFNVFYQNDEFPIEVFNKLKNDNKPYRLYLILKSNTLKVHCQAIDGKVENGFRCSFE